MRPRNDRRQRGPLSSEAEQAPYRHRASRARLAPRSAALVGGGARGDAHPRAPAAHVDDAQAGRRVQRRWPCGRPSSATCWRSASSARTASSSACRRPWRPDGRSRSRSSTTDGFRRRASIARRWSWRRNWRQDPPAAGRHPARARAALHVQQQRLLVPAVARRRLRDGDDAPDRAVGVSVGRQRHVRGSCAHRRCRRRRAGAEVRYERTVEYRADRPVRYLACVISRFVPWDDSGGRAGRRPAGVQGRPIRARRRPTPAPAVNVEVVATPQADGAEPRPAARVAEMLQFYATTIGEAPYPNFTLATLDDNLPGGHSPAFFAVLHQPLPTTPFSWANDPVAFENYPHFFLAHEVAHQWWGQAVGWKNYHEQWISEGLAQYFAALYAESDRGAGDGAQPDAPDARVGAGVRGPGPDLAGLSARPYPGRPARLPRRRLQQVRGRAAHAAAPDRRRGVLRGPAPVLRDSRFQKAGTDDFRAAFEAATPSS